MGMVPILFSFSEAGETFSACSVWAEKGGFLTFSIILNIPFHLAKSTKGDERSRAVTRQEKIALKYCDGKPADGRTGPRKNARIRYRAVLPRS